MKCFSLTYQKVSWQNNLHFPVKPYTENSHLQLKIFYFGDLQNLLKFQKKSAKASNIQKLAFLREILMSFTPFFVFDWNKKASIKR